MALSLTTILGTTTISGQKNIINQNFSDVQTALNYFLNVYDNTSGNIDLTAGTNGILKAKKVLIPTGQAGIQVGSSQLTDNDLITSKVTLDVTYEKATSIQYLTYALSQTGGSAINVADVAKTLVLNPSAASLQIEINNPSSNKMRDLFIVNLSGANHEVQLNFTSNFIDSSSFTAIQIPKGKNCHLRFLNDSNTTTVGWYLVSENGCTLI